MLETFLLLLLKLLWILLLPTCVSRRREDTLVSLPSFRASRRSMVGRLVLGRRRGGKEVQVVESCRRNSPLGSCSRSINRSRNKCRRRIRVVSRSSIESRSSVT